MDNVSPNANIRQSDPQFRTGLSLGILLALLGFPLLAIILYALFDLFHLVSTFGKWILTIVPIMLLIGPILLLRRWKFRMFLGYYAGLLCCFLIAYLLIRVVAWLMTR